MASDVEAEPVIFDGSRQAPDVARISFQNLRLIAVAGELVPSGQTGRPGSDYNYPMLLGLEIRQYSPPQIFLVHQCPIQSQGKVSGLLKILTNTQTRISIFLVN